jgi:hypothetical protein
MQQEGLTHPAPHVIDATRKLVDELRRLDPTEAIDVRILTNDPIYGQFVRVSTGVVLAEIRDPQLLDGASSL